VIEITVKFYILNLAFNTTDEYVRYATLIVYAFMVYIIDAEVTTTKNSATTYKRTTKARKYAAGMKERLKIRPRKPGGDSL